MTDFKFNVGDRVKNRYYDEDFLIIARHASGGNEYWCERPLRGCGTHQETDLTLAPPEQRDFMGAWQWVKEGKTIKRLSSSTVYCFGGADGLVFSDCRSQYAVMWAELIEATDWVLA